MLAGLSIPPTAPLLPRSRLLPCSINNVSHVGHAHPRVAQAVAQQLMTLNTNSRYLDQGLVDYCEALAGLMPDPLQASRAAVLLAGRQASLSSCGPCSSW